MAQGIDLGLAARADQLKVVYFQSIVSRLRAVNVGSIRQRDGGKLQIEGFDYVARNQVQQLGDVVARQQ